MCDVAKALCRAAYLMCGHAGACAATPPCRCLLDDRSEEVKKQPGDGDDDGEQQPERQRWFTEAVHTILIVCSTNSTARISHNHNGSSRSFFHRRFLHRAPRCYANANRSAALLAACWGAGCGTRCVGRATRTVLLSSTSSSTNIAAAPTNANGVPTCNKAMVDGQSMRSPL